MLRTIEVRWFLEVALDQTRLGIEAWFRARPKLGGGSPDPIVWEPAPPAWRADRYLVVPGADDMGIKWREGRLEIKGREADLGPSTFAPGIEGRRERWIKWAYAGPTIERRFLDLFHDDAAGLITVEKRRLQRFLRLDPGGGTIEVVAGAPRERGVDVELAEIRVGGSPTVSYWSLAFEAFPGNPSIDEAFTGIVAGFAEGCPALPLAASWSMAYPRWLSDVNDHADSNRRARSRRS